MAIYKQNIVDIDLGRGQIHRSFLNHSIGMYDQQADRFGIRVLRDGEAVDLTGITVQGVFMPPTGSPIAITGDDYTSVEGNVAEVILPQACYNYEGNFTLAIKLVDVTNTITGTVRIVDGVVDNTHASGTVAPTGSVPTYQEILSVYGDLVDALADVASYASNFAPGFVQGTANAAGTFVMKDGVLYLLPEGHTAGTTWENTTKSQSDVGTQISSLKNALNETDNGVFNVPYAQSFSIVSGGISPVGANTVASNRARTSFVKIVPGKSYRLKITDHDYSFLKNAFTYSSSSGDDAVQITYISENRDEIIFTAGENTNYVRVAFYYTTNSSKTLDSTDYAAIKAGLRICETTDTGLTKTGSAADAKVTGDYIRSLTTLPDGYQQVDYLESTGEQAIIPTAVSTKLNQDSRVVVQFSQTADGVSVNNYLFGSRTDSSSNAFYITILSDGTIHYGYKTRHELSTVINDTDVHTIDCNKNNLYLDGELIYTANEAEFETPSRGVVFAIYATSSDSYFEGYQRIYRYQQYDNGTLVADCIPCKRLSDGEYGMMNVVDGTFYLNRIEGTADFIAGADTNIQSVQTELKNLKNNIESVNKDLTEKIETKGYIKTEADRVSELVRNVQTGESLTFIAVSDLHYKIDSDAIQEALEDMSNAVLQIADQVHIDFYACFGDIIYQLSNSGNFAKGKAEVIGCTKLLNKAFSNNQQIRMTGNHDPNAEGSTGYFTPNQMNAFTGIYSNMLTKNPAVENGGYGYIDFEKQKIRLIVLNTSYYSSSPSQNATQYSMGNDQAMWLGDTLDISDKEGYENWQIVVFAHIALDWLATATQKPVNSGALSKFTRIFNAYETGSRWAVGNYAKDYDGKNAAKLAVYVNGHHHAYIIKNLDYYNTSNEYVRALKLANLYVPNALPGRDGAGTDGVTYNKTANTAESTAFQVVTIDPVNKIVYAHHYGAGIDMIVHYESQEVSSSASLTSSLTSPTWDTNNSSVATVSSGTVTAVATGNTMIWAKSETDNCIEAWNINVPA